MSTFLKRHAQLANRFSAAVGLPLAIAYAVNGHWIIAIVLGVTGLTALLDWNKSYAPPSGN